MHKPPHGTMDWEQIYQAKPVETMHWYYPQLEQDIIDTLSSLGIKEGGLLDLGTGPGVQAIALAKLGFTVTATDIAPTAIRLAREKAVRAGVQVNFQQDDILNTQLEEHFDCIIDRGCFHAMAPHQRQNFVEQVFGLLKPGGVLIMKCFSDQEPGQHGPARFSPAQIREYFGQKFEVLSIEPALLLVAEGAPPQALLCLFKKSQADS